MGNWQRTLKLNPEFRQCQDDEISRQKLAASIARKLRALRPLGYADIDDQREELADTFDTMSRDEDLSEREFNWMLDDLYDWGDRSLDGRWNGKKVCWVDAMTEVPA